MIWLAVNRASRRNGSVIASEVPADELVSQDFETRLSKAHVAGESDVGSRCPEVVPSAYAARHTPAREVETAIQMAFLEARADFQRLLDDDDAGTLFPLVLKPVEEGSSQLTRALAANRAWIDSKLVKSGAILFRGFNVETPQDFNDVVEALDFVEYPYIEVGGGATRTRVFGKVLTVNENYPPDRDMGFHSEACNLETQPTKVMFFCEIPPPPGTGGSTLIVHGSSVYKRLMAKQGPLMQELGGGFDYIWAESGKPVFKSRFVGIKEDRAGRMSWFNSLGFLFLYKMPNIHVQLVNGKVLTREDLAPCLLPVLEEEKVEVAWEKGDVLLVDNTAVQHGRKAYCSTRRILVALAK